MGRLLVDSINQRDYPIVQAVLLLFVAPGRGYVALGDTDTDTDAPGDPDPEPGVGVGADRDPVGAAGGTSGYPVAGSQEVRTRPAR